MLWYGSIETILTSKTESRLHSDEVQGKSCRDFGVAFIPCQIAQLRVQNPVYTYALTV